MTIFDDRTFWNHVGFHRRPVWVYVYYNKNTHTITQFIKCDKKRIGDRRHLIAFATTHLFCYRILVKPSSKFHPDTIWKKGKPRPEYVRKLTTSEKLELGLPEKPKRRRNRNRSNNGVVE